MSELPPPPDSPQVYMTPQLQKRRDGLAPSLLRLSAREPQDPKTALTKSYQTSSKYLTVSVVNSVDVDDSKELQKIVDSVATTLEELVDRTTGSKDLASLKFLATGCKWTLEFSPSLRADSHVLEVVSEEGGSFTSTSGFKDAKAAFDLVALQVRKAVVACEFPEFPEGCKGIPFRDVYQLNARLKSGSFATVCRGTHRATGKKVAIKCVLRKDLPPSDDAAIYDEVAILASVEHAHIVPLIDFFDEKDCYFIVMELMCGGDLFDRIGKKKTYSEADARDLSSKMLKAMAYCHTRNIAHCDMKPKNLLLVSDDNDSYIKLADFGFAARVHEPKSLTKQCGTPFFVSPEILTRQSYDQMSDMWSCGCIVYLLLGGNLPFMGRSQKELFRKIVEGKYEFDEESFAGVSDEAKDLVSKMLVRDPDKRISASDALKHPWLRQENARLTMIKLTGTSQRLKTFNAKLKLRSAMIAIDWISTLKRSPWVKGLTDQSETRRELSRLGFEDLSKRTLQVSEEDKSAEK
ncbi:serine/threonine protein kinase [Fragilaria crotonensis]|nr:serine/threonine protein kinase [Fragilaria crotonensis]